MMDENNLELVYRQVSASKTVAGDEFEKGIQDFNFSMGRPTCWIPSKSYFLVTSTLLGPAGVRPSTRNQVALADNFCGSLYSSATFRVGGQDVSSNSTFIPQCHALRTRSMKSQAFLASVGKSANMSVADFQERVAITSSDDLLHSNSQQEYFPISYSATVGTLSLVISTGVITASEANSFLKPAIGTSPAYQLIVGDIVVMGGSFYTITEVRSGTDLTVAITTAVAGATAIVAPVGTFYGLKMRRRDGTSRNTTMTVFQPPIGIFNHDAPMGSGDYSFSLNPNPNYKQSCVESAWRNLTATPADYNFLIVDVKLFIATIKSTIPANMPPLILYEMKAYSKQLGDLGGTFDYTVPSSTVALVVFVQPSVTGANTLAPPTRFTSLDGAHNTITGLQITYANTTKPASKWASAFNTTNNSLQQRYLDNLTESGIIDSPGGAEPFGDWLQRGPYYYYSFNRDRSDKSTPVNVDISFSSNVLTLNVVLVAIYAVTTDIVTEDGWVVSVSSK